MTQANYQWVDGGAGSADDLNKLFNVLPPLGATISYSKTPSWAVLSSGSADTNTTDKLVDSGATFQSDGVQAGYIIYNSTDGTFAIAGTVESETSIALIADTKGGSTATDVFPLGTEGYSIYAQFPPPDGWVEMNGQTLTGDLAETNSLWNGSTLPNYNGVSGGTQRFIRGSSTSGSTGGAETHTHSPTPTGSWSSASPLYDMVAANHLPPYFEEVWIKRIY